MTFCHPEFDTEGRTLAIDYGDFILYNIYFPNGGNGPERLDYKLRFYEAFFEHIKKTVEAGRNIIVCGDVNTAHNEIDLARPKENVKNSGFMPVERAWLDKVFQNGFTDVFRHFHKEAERYTWWDVKTRARERNIGWRIDYFIVNDGFVPAIKDCDILQDVPGSDHCPVYMEL
jgi:exodeoxyribonuclease-3